MLTARPNHYAAFIVEPIQAEGGIIEPPANYLREAQEVCRQAGVLFVLDEVQTGLGRTGRLFACEAEDISPDIMTLAKALGGGLMPIGACLYAPTAYSRRFDLRHSSTFAGNTLACRAGLAAIELLLADGEFLIRQVAECGEYLRERLEVLQRRYSPLIRSIRGRGYLMGVELDFSSIRDTGSLLDYLSNQDTLIHLVVAHLLNVEKVRVAPSISAGPVLRIEPPLIAGREECDVFAAALGRVLDILQRGDTGRLLAFLIGGYPTGGETYGRPAMRCLRSQSSRRRPTMLTSHAFRPPRTPPCRRICRRRKGASLSSSILPTRTITFGSIGIWRSSIGPSFALCDNGP